MELSMKNVILPICLSVLMFSTPVFAEGDEAGFATIITSFEKGAQCISPMVVQNVDGEELASGRTQITLAPGTHTINGAAQVNTSFCRSVGISRGGRKEATPALEAEFEAGKTYYIGLNHKASRPDGWFYEVWKTEDTK
jgi:hypothetical protein